MKTLDFGSQDEALPIMIDGTGAPQTGVGAVPGGYRIRQGRFLLMITYHQFSEIVAAASDLGEPQYPLPRIRRMVFVPHDGAFWPLEVTHNGLNSVGGWRVQQGSSRVYMTTATLTALFKAFEQISSQSADKAS